MRSIIVISLLLANTISFCQVHIVSGPMVGYSAMKEVGIWIQLSGEAEVSVKYYATHSPTDAYYTESIQAGIENDFIVQPTATSLEPGTTYSFEVAIDGKHVEVDYPCNFQTQTLWQHRFNPPDFTFVAGSCTYVNETKYDRPGKPYGGNYEIFREIIKDSADFMVWLGDNTYLREADWDSRSGIFHRYKHTRSLEELQPLLASVHHYAIWDDHDYGPNDSDYSYTLKDYTREAFTQFWRNPSYGFDGFGGITSFFSWSDCDFFLLDNRWVRSSPKEDGCILGDAQLEWLETALKASKATFKFICIGGQVLSDFKGFENYAVFSKEREQLLNILAENGIKNVIFLTGDRHHSEVSRMVLDNGITVYDITSSPLTSGSYDHSDEPNHHRMEGSIIGDRNYALIEVTGEPADRILTLEFKNSKGDVVYTQQIKRQ